MSVHAFVLTLVVGSALLAGWIMTRYTRFGPRSVVWALVHTGVACVLLELLPVAFAAISASGVPGVVFVKVFGVALPLLVYGFLSGGWTTRAAMSLLP